MTMNISYNNNLQIILLDNFNNKFILLTSTRTYNASETLFLNLIL